MSLSFSDFSTSTGVSFIPDSEPHLRHQIQKRPLLSFLSLMITVAYSLAAFFTWTDFFFVPTFKWLKIYLFIFLVINALFYAMITCNLTFFKQWFISPTKTLLTHILFIGLVPPAIAFYIILVLVTFHVNVFLGQNLQKRNQSQSEKFMLIETLIINCLFFVLEMYGIKRFFNSFQPTSDEDYHLFE